MSLIKKTPVIESSAPYYTLGDESVLLIAGLGNIGKEYENTRHNIGFKIVENFAVKHEFPAWSDKTSLKCLLSEGRVGKHKVILIKPSTYMNNSGEAVRAAQNFFKISASNTLVVHDDIDIAFGQVRTRTGGKSAGHKGIESIIKHIGEDFGRMRIGIGPKKPAGIKSEDFVLKNFPATQKKELNLLLQESNSILSEYCFNGGKLTAETRSFIL